MEILLYPDPSLKKVCIPVDLSPEIKESNLANLKSFTDDMTKLMYDNYGFGLAAPQVGYSIRVFVALIANEPRVFINPKIIEFGGNEITQLKEGCLSIPWTQAKTSGRYDLIRVEAFDLKGELFLLKLMAKDAIVCQHELDHLEGETIFDRMGVAQRTLKRKQYMKKYKAYIKSNKGKK